MASSMDSGAKLAAGLSLVVSAAALGAVVATVALRAPSPRRRRRDEDLWEDDVDRFRRQMSPGSVQQQHGAANNMQRQCSVDTTAGREFVYGMGFSMAEAKALAESGHVEARTKSPAEVLENLQRGNTRFWTGAAMRPEKSAFERRALISKQFPSVAILGCADSRVPTEIIFDQALGDMFTVRVAGNCLDTTTMASLQYSVHVLKVKVLVVLGHEGCGAIKACQQSDEALAREPRELTALLTGLKSHLSMETLGTISDPKAKDREAVNQNVKRQVEKLTEDPSIMSKVRSGELLVVGAFYEISSGIVDFFHEVLADAGDSTPASAPGVDRKPSRGVLTGFVV